MHNLDEVTIGKMNPAIVYRLCAIVNYFSSYLLVKDFQAIRRKMAKLFIEHVTWFVSCLKGNFICPVVVIYWLIGHFVQGAKTT